MAGQQLAADGGLGDITNLLNLVKDQKTTTSTNISQQGVTQQINDILQGNAGLASVAGAQKAGGFYNSSTNTLLQNDLLARAASQVAAKNATVTTAKKASVSKQNIEALLASKALSGAIGSDTVKAGAKHVVGSIADELGLPAYANDTATEQALNSVAGAGPGAQVGDFTSLESSIAGSGGDLGVAGLDSGTFADGTSASIGGLTSADLTEGAGAGLASASGATATQVASFDSGTAAGLAGTESLFGEGAGAAGAIGDSAATAGVADVGGLAALDSAAVAGEGAEAGLGIGTAAEGADLGLAANSGELASLGPYGLAAGAALYLGTKYGSQIDDNFTQPVGDAIGDVIHGAGDAIGDVAKGAGWIVCTELLRQGRFNARHYAAGLAVFNNYPKHLLEGYYIWARPLVQHIRTKPGSPVSKLTQHVFSERAEYLAAIAGVRGARDTFYGQLISASIYIICYVLGQYLHAREVRSWKKILGEFCGY